MCCRSQGQEFPALVLSSARLEGHTTGLVALKNSIVRRCLALRPQQVQFLALIVSSYCLQQMVALRRLGGSVALVPYFHLLVLGSPSQMSLEVIREFQRCSLGLYEFSELVYLFSTSMSGSLTLHDSFAILEVQEFPLVGYSVSYAFCLGCKHSWVSAYLLRN